MSHHYKGGPGAVGENPARRIGRANLNRGSTPLTLTFLLRDSYHHNVPSQSELKEELVVQTGGAAGISSPWHQVSESQHRQGLQGGAIGSGLPNLGPQRGPCLRCATAAGPAGRASTDPLTAGAALVPQPGCTTSTLSPSVATLPSKKPSPPRRSRDSGSGHDLAQSRGIGKPRRTVPPHTAWIRQ
jgi:hypothetical protein